MQDGSKMIKLAMNRKGHAKKTFILDEDMTGIRYTPSKKKCKCRLTGTEFVLGQTRGYEKLWWLLQGQGHKMNK